VGMVPIELDKSLSNGQKCLSKILGHSLILRVILPGQLAHCALSGMTKVCVSIAFAGAAEIEQLYPEITPQLVSL
jgi:hypothetical protein